jgi:predicted outer membrane repeat protein
MIVILISIPLISANENVTQTLESADSDITAYAEETNLADKSTDLEKEINDAQAGAEILIEPGTYKIHNIKITKNLTLQGNGNARDIIIDGEEKSSIFLIRSQDVHITFKNITFINGLTHSFGGAISIETGNVYVDECIFANNTALSDTNAGAISNYGTKDNKGYLFVNNSLFINNHADHDGGAITTCYANSDIYNCVFINNSACRDGGAIRVSVKGYGNVQDCIFMFNHADEWGGAYYSWSGESNIERCIFMNNTAGTNGGAVMVSGDINIQDSIIVNNKGGETGGSFYIQNPMYNTKTVMNIRNNLITNNSSPYGKEIYINWERAYAYNLYTQFDDNDWGDEDPNDSSVNDPDEITARSKVSKTVKSNLFERLNVDLLGKYEDLLKGYFPDDSLDNLKEQFKAPEENNNKNDNSNTKKVSNASKTTDDLEYEMESNTDNENDKTSTDSNTESELTHTTSTNQLIYGNSTSHGENDKAYELNETGGSVAKQIKSNIIYIIALIAITLILLAIGYKRNRRLE